MGASSESISASTIARFSVHAGERVYFLLSKLIALIKKKGVLNRRLLCQLPFARNNVGVIYEKQQRHDSPPAVDEWARPSRDVARRTRKRRPDFVRPIRRDSQLRLRRVRFCRSRQ